MMFVIVIKIAINLQNIFQTEMLPSEKKSQTTSTFESSHKSNANGLNDGNDYKDDIISETSSLHLYRNVWDERQFENVRPTNFGFRDSLPQVNFT